jgi:hypothetical protein|tara:strand:- start:4620 stop:4970 length:351 start_codon:yes stop_codon:yes gene_type:complete
MEKFLSIPVLDAHGTNSQNQLVSVTDVVKVQQSSTTAVAIDYRLGKRVTLTWPGATGVAAPALEVAVSNQIVEALQNGWTHVDKYYAPKGMVDGAAVPEESGSFANINPLASIAIT